MKKKFIILPVVAMLMVCGFSACSQDDDLFEYDLGNDEVATLAKRSMPRNGEVIIPPTPPKEDDEKKPRKIQLGYGDFYQICPISIPLISNTGEVHYEERLVGIGGTVVLYWVEGKDGKSPHFEATLSFEGEGLEGSISEISEPNSGGIVYVQIVAGPNEEDSGTATITVEVETDPGFDYNHAFDD